MKRNIVIIVLLLIIGIGGAANWRTTATHDEHGHDEGAHGETEVAPTFPRGPHSGRLFVTGDFGLELRIYETGVEPQFRVYPYRSNQPLDPSSVTLTVTVQRLGATETIRFKPEADYLLGDQVIYEPHSFDVVVNATYADKPYQWSYSQTEGRVHIAPESLKSGGIEVQTASPRSMKTVLRMPGEIKIKHDQRVHIVPRVAGVALEIPKGLGAQVKKGDVLLVLDSREVAELKSAYLTAQQRLELATTTYNREAGLWKQKITSEQEYFTAQREKAEAEIALKAAAQSLLALGISTQVLGNASNTLSRFTVHAPFDGVIIARAVAYGASVAADAHVFELANIADMEAEIAVYAQDIDKVKVGQHVTLRALSADLVAQGSVSFISSVLGEKSRSAIAHVEFPNPDARWREGQFVEAEIVQEEVTVPVAVEVDAVQTFRDWSVVFAQFGDQFEVRPVELGRVDGDWVEIVAGIKAGQAYAAHNAFVLKAELGKAGASHDH